MKFMSSHTQIAIINTGKDMLHEYVTVLFWQTMFWQ